MKRTVAALSAVLLCAGAFGQESAVFETENYTIEYPSNLQDANSAFVAFEAIRAAMDEVFRFGPNDIPQSIVICADKAGFDEYVSAIIGETRNQYLFLKYADPAASRLILYPAPGKSGYNAFSGPALNRQLFLQYLYARISEPPLWIRDGFQAYFENISFDPAAGAVITGAYSPWLETAKNLAADPARAISPVNLISALTADYESATFYPQAWSLVRFFLTTEKSEYQRFLHEAFVVLQTASSEGYNRSKQGENTALAASRFSRLVNPDTAAKDFAAWINSQRTYGQMLQQGMDAYSSGSYESARSSFSAAYAVHPEDPMLLYYRGLVEYADKKYALAEGWYRKALQSGAETSTVNWALALNAIADGRSGEARVYLETAKAANPVRYGEKADKLLNSLPK